MHAAAADDNLQLLLYFLRDKTTNRQRDFYQTNVFYPMTAHNSWVVCSWYLKRKYKIPSPLLTNENGPTISVAMLEELVVDDSYDEHLLAAVIRYDRADIFNQRYLGTPRVTSEYVKEMMRQDALKCFDVWITTAKKKYYVEIRHMVISLAGKRIVNRLLLGISSYSEKRLPSTTVTKLVSNPHYNSLEFMTYFPETDPRVICAN